jgi:DNA-binding beta-propeller fold protein YncE
LWAKRYNGPLNGGGHAVQLAISPSGGTVYVTGDSDGAGYGTVAYNATTGAQLWVARYTGPGSNTFASSVAVSPDGRTVYVTGYGQMTPAGTNYAYATVAYNATTGARLWVARYNGGGYGDNYARSVAVSPDGKTVYVTGQSQGATSVDYGTVAYNATTGAQLWIERYSGVGNSSNDARALAVNPTTGTVYVTGGSEAAKGGFDFATVAYHS